MTRHLIIVPVLFAALQLTAFGKDKTGDQPPVSHNSEFEKMKKLVGTWVTADKDGKPTDQVASVIKVTAGGSVIHETIFPGQPHEMVSVYAVDGSDFVMTHYCVLGNQPRMKADPKAPADEIVFQFAGGSNLDPSKDKHMHESTLTIIDSNHIQVKGVGWSGGAPMKDMCCGLSLVRKN